MGRLADRPAARARLKRSMYPIRAYVGPNGTGKSALLIYDAVANLERGRPQLSTVRLLDYRNPGPCPGGQACDDPANHVRERMAHHLRPEVDFETWLLQQSPDGIHDSTDAAVQARFAREVPLLRTSAGTGVEDVHAKAHPLYVPFRSFTQLVTWTDGDILMDEVTGVASSRESGSMPVQVANYLVQLRRRNVSLSWSTPSWGRADKVIREVTQLVTLMTASMPKRAPCTADGQVRLWHQRRLFCARSYDPSGVDEFEAHRAMSEEVSPAIIAFYWGPGSTMFKAYDTMNAVTSLGWANDSGMCMGCGGKRTVIGCSCPDHLEKKAAAKPPSVRGPRPAPLEVVPAPRAARSRRTVAGAP